MLMNKALVQFKMDKVQMNKLGGGYSAICDMYDGNGTYYPTEIRFTTISNEKELCQYLEKTNEGYTVTGCRFN